jgi:hypothetical protein
MAKIKWVIIASLVILMLITPLFAACPAPTPTTTAPATTPSTTGPTTTPPPAQQTLYIGGTMSLTGAYAEDSAAVLAGFEDYAQYVTDNHITAPWYADMALPANVKVEVLWRDDELSPEKALSNYEELKAKGLLVEHGSGSPQVLALMDLLNEDRIGATTQAIGPYLLSPPKTFFIQSPIYTDACAAIADWFLESWQEASPPKVAILTADNAMGKYLESAGYVYVGEQYVPLVPTSPPTTQLLWLKNNNVNLALGVMINPGAQPTVKEMDRLDMGPDKAYKIVFGTATPGHAWILARDMGELGDGYVCAGSLPPPEDLTVPGVQFCSDLQNTYRADNKVNNIMYEWGVVEAMIQVEALRLALVNTGLPVDQLRSVDVLESGFYQIKDLDTGGITSTPLTFGPGQVYGISEVLVQQVQGGKPVALGTWPVHDIYKHE